MSTAGRHRPLAQEGNSLIEVVLASSLVVVLLCAVLPSLLLGSRSVDRISNRAETLDDARFGLTRISREIRSAAAVTAATGQVVDMTTWSGGALVSTRIDCSQPGRKDGTWSCYRTRDGKRHLLLREVRNAAPFRVSTDRRFMEIQITHMPRAGVKEITLRVAVGLRGCLPQGTIIGTCTGTVIPGVI